MERLKGFLQRAILVAGLAISMAAITACGSVHHAAKFESGFSPRPDTKIELGTVMNESGKTFEFDIAKMLSDALAGALKDEGLLWAGGQGADRLILGAKIVEYEEGDAFKRWLLPGWGSTVLSVQGDMKETVSGRLIGSVEARRTVSFGGGYTIGAWRTIFASLAKDMVKELRSKMGS